MPLINGKRLAVKHKGKECIVKQPVVVWEILFLCLYIYIVFKPSMYSGIYMCHLV
jgi:hypothetical protein